MAIELSYSTQPLCPAPAIHIHKHYTITLRLPDACKVAKKKREKEDFFNHGSNPGPPWGGILCDPGPLSEQTWERLVANAT